ncbi:MAG: ankyrin repeat domain-containing protein [Sedimenticola sp.]|nr:ankyrin repeat domain-containing protein [Sedimenticola sp.]
MKRRLLFTFGLLTSCSVLTACSPEQPLNTEPAIPPLISAAEAGDTQRIALLLEDAAAVDSRDSCQWTPLMKASLFGHTEAANQLLSAGAELELTDKGGYSALMLAASNNHAVVVQNLLKQGANPNRQESSHGWTALIWAAKRGHKESVRALVEGGAAIELADFDGKNARNWAVENHHDEVAALLSKR